MAQVKISELTAAAAAAGAMQLEVNDAGTSKRLTLTQVYTGVTEEEFTITGTTPVINPANGTQQVWTLSGASTPTFSFAAGQSLSLLVDDGTAGTITWPAGTKFIGGAAPVLATTGFSGKVITHDNRSKQALDAEAFRGRPGCAFFAWRQRWRGFVGSACRCWIRRPNLDGA
jgi:hypothetical protein